MITLVLSMSGCMAVIGYEPTPAELDAIRRGEDPRANEDQQREQAQADHQGSAGESGEHALPGREDVYEAGPTEGTVLRWLDSASLVIEANERRETVFLAGEQAKDDPDAEQAALNERMDHWTYGTAIRLRYPLKDQKGDAVYRDREGRLLASID